MQTKKSQEEKLKDVFSETGNEAVYLQRAKDLGERLKHSVIDDMESRYRVPESLRPQAKFPLSFSAFSYAGMEQGHYKKPMGQKEAFFLMEFSPHPERPIDMVCLKFRCDELIGLLHTYGDDKRISVPILEALKPLGAKAREDQEFVREMMAECDFDHVLRTMRQGPQR